MLNKWSSLIFWGIILILSLTNIILFGILLETKHQVADIATQAENILQQAQKTSSFISNVTINDSFEVPIKTDIPVKTTVDVPVTIPLLGQTVSVAVPINATVPIDMTVQVPIKTTIPVSINLDNSPFGSILQRLQNLLALIARL